MLPYKSERDAHQKIKIKLLVVVFVVFFFFLLVSRDSYVLRSFLFLMVLSFRFGGQFL